MLDGSVCVRGDFPEMLFYPQARPKTVKNRVHLDTVVSSLDPLLSMGATVLDEYLPVRVTMADVEGNEFCAFLDADSPSNPPARVFAVCTDSERPEELAAWWAQLVAAHLVEGADGTRRWLRGPAGWSGLVWKFVRVGDEPLGRRADNTDEPLGRRADNTDEPLGRRGDNTDERAVPNRWRWTVRADTAELVAAGAKVVEPGVLIDPQGNEFSVTD
jgi:hypothetical protein